jgi:hypothetical protein
LDSKPDPVLELEPELNFIFLFLRKKLGKKNLEPGVNQRLTIGFRPGYLEPKLKPGLISRTGTKIGTGISFSHNQTRTGPRVYNVPMMFTFVF